MPAADFARARRSMVTDHLRPGGVRNPRLLAALEAIPRERFVPSAQARLATVDRHVPLGGGRFLMDPLALARLMEEALRPPFSPTSSRVLDLGPGTGYSTALWAALASDVTALEEDPALAAATQTNLVRLRATHAQVVQGPLKDGWPSDGPYDVIFMNGGVEEVPSSFVPQLTEGGCLLTVVLRPTATVLLGEARRYERRNGALSFRGLFDLSVPELPGFALPARFSLEGGIG